MQSLEPIMASAESRWPGAVWIGQVDESDLVSSYLTLAGGERFRSARLLVWSGDQVRGFVEVPIADGAVDGSRVRAEVANLPPVAARQRVEELPAISVVLCTRDHPEDLRGALQSLTYVEYPEFEVIVVDNNPSSGLTPPVVDSFDDTRIRLVEAIGQGLSIARNVGLKSARHGIVAFTDDDVVVDPCWLKNLVYGFLRNERVACVCGMAASAELVTPAQSYFDRRVGWDRCDPAVYELAAPPEQEPLFPFRVAAFGTGANFAVRTEVVRELGGFDEGLGAGSPSGGSEDIDMFVRILLAGYMLEREPSAVIWHRHRRTIEELETQMYNYGLGLGAWISKLLTAPRTFGVVIRRFRSGLRHLRWVTAVKSDEAVGTEPGLDRLPRRELLGVLNGPLALMRSRLLGRSSTPLKSIAAAPMRMFDFRRGQMWGEPGNSIAAGRLSLAAVVVGMIGSLGALSVLPMFFLVFAVGAFVLAGPGSLVLSWYSHLPKFALVPLVLAVSVALCILVVSGLLMLGFYDPVVILLAMTSATIVGGLFRCAYLAQRKVVKTS